jgi:hypothetical protein
MMLSTDPQFGKFQMLAKPAHGEILGPELAKFPIP